MDTETRDVSETFKAWLIDDPNERYLSVGQVFFLALACCLLIGNMYGAQPIISDIAESLGIPMESSGIILTLAQIGYGAGVLLLVPLGDSFDNKRLILILLCGVALSLFLVHLVTVKMLFFTAIFCLGLCSSVVQLIIPFSTGLIRPSQRGRLISFIVAGAALGMVLGRPLFSTLTGIIGWRVSYLAATAAVSVIFLLFWRLMPGGQKPGERLSYPAMFVSMGRLFAARPKVRCQVFMLLFNFTGFTLFWSSAPIMLAADLGFSHHDIAMLSMASLAAPLAVMGAGMLADKGLRLAIIGFGACLCLTAFLVTPILGLVLATMLVAVIFMDSGLNMSNVFIQQSLLLENADARSRLNALCISVGFAGGSVGSFFGPYIYKHYGWTATALTGACLSLAALGMYLRMRSAYRRDKAA